MSGGGRSAAVPKPRRAVLPRPKFRRDIINLNGTVTIYNSTLAYNATRLGNNIVADSTATLAQGGAIYNLSLGQNPPPAVLHLGNSILSNTLSAGSPLDLVNDNQQGKTTATIDSSGPSLVTACNFCDNPQLVGGLQFIVKQDPMLETLADNGGAAETLAPGPASQAIGRGDPALCTGTLVNGLDQRGLSRPAACTLGAYEATSEDDAAPGGCQTLPGRHRGPASAGALLALLALAAFASHRRQRTEQG